MTTFIGSTAFAPADWKGSIHVERMSVEQVRSYIAGVREAGGAIRSYCGHLATATYLGVAWCRESAPGPEPGETQVWLGIRPVRRPAIGEELDPAIDPAAFTGQCWIMVGRARHRESAE